MGNDARLHQDGESNTRQRAVKMRVVIHPVVLIAGSVNAIGQVQSAENESGNADWNKKQIEPGSRIKKDKTEQDSGNGSGGAQAGVTGIVPMLDNGRDVAKDQSTNIQDRKLQVSIASRGIQNPLQWEGEKEKGKHIEQQVSEIGMDQPTGQYGINPLLPDKAVGVQHELMIQILIHIQAVEACNQGEDKNDEGDGGRLK